MSEKKIIGYVCRLCALAANDLGPPRAKRNGVKIETIELPCAGKVDELLLLAAFEKGADAVFVLGCLEHECMNMKGAARARKRLEHARDILNQAGIGGERLVMYNVSGTLGPRFAQIEAEMAALAEKLGASPAKKFGKARNQTR